MPLGNKTSKLQRMKRLLPLFLLLSSSPTLAESGAYRVEVIIFRHLQTTAKPAEIGELRKFSQFPALEKDQPFDLWPPGPTPGFSTNPAADVTSELPETRIETPVEDSIDGPADNSPGNTVSDLPDDLLPITELSRRMRDVWTRLRSSRDFQPIVFGAWEQNRTDYYPPVRIHDQQVIDVQLRPPTQIMVADLVDRDPLAAYRSYFYRLDGSVQLRRSRFLHLYLDLVYRNEMTEPGAEEPGAEPVSPDAGDTESAIKDVTGPTVFELQENRQIRTGQMQYFDTPSLGALVWVTAISSRDVTAVTSP